MGRFRSTMRQSPAIIISLMALTLSLGGGAGYAASVATAKAPAPTKITWHALKVLKGWHGNTFKLGDPAYAVSNGVVYLAGAANYGSNISPLPVLAVLPKGARPRQTLELGAYSSSAVAPAAIYIYSNGDIVAGGANAYYTTSLAGISFPAGE
jgi:hypothetical protein